MSKSILITRPDYDLMTKYLCAWSEMIVEFARDKGNVVYDLKGRKANKSEFESYIKVRRPSFVFLNGHGDAAVITGYENEILVDESSDLKGMVIYARSCDAGQHLGFLLVANGVRSFICYKRKFIFGYSPEKLTKPLEDDIARLFLEPSNLVASTLIKSKTAQEAHDRSRDAMYRNFRKMVSSAASFEERHAARWMWGNINSQILIGDPAGQV